MNGSSLKRERYQNSPELVEEPSPARHGSRRAGRRPGLTEAVSCSPFGYSGHRMEPNEAVMELSAEETANLTPDTFFRRFVAPRRPVALRGPAASAALDPRLDAADWTPARLAADAASAPRPRTVLFSSLLSTYLLFSPLSSPRPRVRRSYYPEAPGRRRLGGAGATLVSVPRAASVSRLGGRGTISRRRHLHRRPGMKPRPHRLTGLLVALPPLPPLSDPSPHPSPPPPDRVTCRSRSNAAAAPTEGEMGGGRERIVPGRPLPRSDTVSVPPQLWGPCWRSWSGGTDLYTSPLRPTRRRRGPPPTLTPMLPNPPSTPAPAPSATTPSLRASLLCPAWQGDSAPTRSTCGLGVGAAAARAVEKGHRLVSTTTSTTTGREGGGYRLAVSALCHRPAPPLAAACYATAD